jgi:N utilization substance protein A
MLSEMSRVIDQVSRDKGVDRKVLIATLEEALQSAARKKLGPRAELEVRYNEGTGDIDVFQYKEVVLDVEDPELQITLEEARKLDPESEPGDSIGTRMDTSTFGRIAAQSAKQVIIQKLKDAERDAVYKNFIDRRGEIINGIVQRVDRGDIIVNLGQTEGVLPVREQAPRESYHRGDRVRALVLDVSVEGRGPQVILTRTHPNFLVNLFKMEVPEIGEGVVSVMACAREAGVRSKIAVASSDSDIDAVGACVGMKGSRVQNVVHELRGEKIDIVPWHADSAKFVCNSLAPAQISRVIIDEEGHAMEVIVPDEFLSVAIGKKGQNVRLASRLTGWHLDVKSETRYSRTMQDGYDSLLALPGLGVNQADALYEKGFYSVDELAGAALDDLAAIRGIDETEAARLVREARAAVGMRERRLAGKDKKEGDGGAGPAAQAEEAAGVPPDEVPEKPPEQ